MCTHEDLQYLERIKQVTIAHLMGWIERVLESPQCHLRPWSLGTLAGC
uniref:Uncharacterized protein n=1 Tax=Arundo donax TaxID=35708 RepID=A0A0A9E2X7_ARUDO